MDHVLLVAESGDIDVVQRPVSPVWGFCGEQDWNVTGSASQTHNNTLQLTD